MKKILSGILLSLLIFSQAFASAKVIIPAGHQLKIHAESDIVNGDYSWVLLSNDGYILNNQNGPIFNTKFKKAGKYKLNVTVTDKKTGETKFTHTEIIVGNPNKFWNNFDVKIQSLPKISENNEIKFSGTGGKVNFFFGNSKGIKKIYLDKNINEDSNGDGKTDDDNVLAKACPTFEKCKKFDVNLEQPKTGDLKIKFTFQSFSGKKEERIFKVLFNVKEKKSEKFLLKINTLPGLNSEKNEIFVPFGINETVINLEQSSGDFLEYQIDQDIDKDSDLDGIKDNDIDNKNSKSFTDGSSFKIKKGSKNSQTAKITLKSGKKTKTKKIKIIWGKENENKEINVYSSTNQNFIKKEIFFGIENLDTKKYSVEWDFDGDGKIDKKNKIYTSYKFSKEGNYETKIFIKDKKTGKIFKKSSLKIEIKKPIENEISTSEPEADFDFKINGPNVNFSQNTKIDEKLLNQNFKSLWKFGNGNISKEKNPVFLYTKTGTYLVNLTVTDSAGNSNSKEKEVKITDLSLKKEIIKEDGGSKTGNIIDFFGDKNTKTGSVDFFGNDNNQNENNKVENPTDQNENPSDFLSNFLLRLAILIASILGIVGIYLIIQKIKYPDMEFGEILDEERERILSWIDGEEYEHPVENISEEIHDEVEEIKEVKKEEKTEGKEKEIKKPEPVQKKEEVKPEPKKEPEKKPEENKIKTEEKPKNPFADFGKEKNSVKKPEEKKSNSEKNFSNEKKNFSEPKKIFSENKKIPEKKPEIKTTKIKNSPVKKPEKNPFADFGKDRIQKKEENKKPEIKKQIPKPETKPIIKKPESPKPQKQNIPSPPPPPPSKKEEIKKPETKKIEEDDNDIPDFLK